MTHSTDVCIVGAGIAGLVTALELLDSDKKIMIIDRDLEENIGGLARWSFGGMFFVDSKTQRKAGISDSLDLAMRDWFSYAQFDEAEKWGPKWAEKYIHTCTEHSYEWLKSKGIKYFPVVNWVERGLLEPGNSVPRFHMVWGTGWELVKVLHDALKSHRNFDHIHFLFQHRVLELVTQNDEVVGVRGVNEMDQSEFEIKSECVVAATGGINGSIERVKQHWFKPWGDPPSVILNGSHKFAIGDLHDATEEVNGHVVNLDKQWNYAAGIRHYKPQKPDHGLSLIPCKSALWLNYQGKRIGPMPLITGYDTRFIVKEICKQPIKYSWQILNMKIAYKEFAISGSEHNEAIRDKKLFKFLFTILTGNKKLVHKIIDQCEDVVIGNSVEELVQKMNELTGEGHVREEFVKDAVYHYDGQIDRGRKYQNDEQLRRIAHARQYRGDRTRTSKFQKIVDHKAMPLIAIREFILSRKSLGGIQTDLDCRVLSTPDASGNQHSINGLFAVGEASGFGGGGMHGLRSLEGTFLGACVITGRVAARTIVTGKGEL